MVKNTLPEVDPLLDHISCQLQARFKPAQLQTCVMIGIRTGGAWIAGRLHASLPIQTQLGILDISFYRDDFSQSGLNPTVKPSNLSCSIDNRQVILVDDVIMSGRTVRAAMNEIFDYGRPQSITLVSLIDLSSRALPIQPDIVGHSMALKPSERIKLTGPEPLNLSLQNK